MLIHNLNINLNKKLNLNILVIPISVSSSWFEDNNVSMLHSIEGESLGVEVMIPAFLYSLFRLLKQSKSLPLAAFLIFAPIIKNY